jgi:hypothetical protein
MPSIHVGDIGTVIRVLIPDETGAGVPLQAATGLTVILISPFGVIKERAAQLNTDGSDFKIKYATQAGDIDVPGTWEAKGRVTIGGSTWTGDPATFTVMD